MRSVRTYKKPAASPSKEPETIITLESVKILTAEDWQQIASEFARLEDQMGKGILDEAISLRNQYESRLPKSRESTGQLRISDEDRYQLLTDCIKIRRLITDIIATGAMAGIIDHAHKLRILNLQRIKDELPKTEEKIKPSTVILTLENRWKDFKNKKRSSAKKSSDGAGKLNKVRSPVQEKLVCTKKSMQDEAYGTCTMSKIKQKPSSIEKQFEILNTILENVVKLHIDINRDLETKGNQHKTVQYFNGSAFKDNEKKFNSTAIELMQEIDDTFPTSICEDKSEGNIKEKRKYHAISLDLGIRVKRYLETYRKTKRLMGKRIRKRQEEDRIKTEIEDLIKAVNKTTSLIEGHIDIANEKKGGGLH